MDRGEPGSGPAQGVRLRPGKPANLMPNITARTSGVREQVVTVTGGPGGAAGSPSSVEACEGRSPHGFIEQEAAVAAGIARFIREGTY